MAKAPDIIIGTSGWQYRDWNGGVFYPPAVRGKAQLPYFAEQFQSVEINSTFYHFPRRSSVENWATSVPNGFEFVIKLNRYLSHNKRLTIDDESLPRLRDFIESLAPLGNKLAAILVQLPPSMRLDLKRLEQFVAAVRELTPAPLAIEYRHASWFTDQTYEVMRRLGVANVINDSPGRWPASRAVTTDFAYLRFHGNRELYRSSYTDEELRDWARFIQRDCGSCRRVFCFFNNDYDAVGVANARMLRQIVGTSAAT